MCAQAETSGAIRPPWNADGVLAHLHQRGDPGAFDPVGDAFGVLDGDDVEREDGGVLGGRRGDEVGCGGQRHDVTRRRGPNVWNIRRS